MGTIKQDRLDLEKLLNGIDPLERNIPQTQEPARVPQGSIVDAPLPSDNLEVKAFEYDYDASKKGLRKKAKKTVLAIISHVISDDTMLEEDYIKDKIEQDIDTLTDLYVRKDTGEVMQKALMESVSKGNMMPRMFEVYNQMTDQAQSINKQIYETEQRIRKSYIDIKYEINDRRSEQGALPGQVQCTNALDSAGGVIIASTKSLIDNARKAHIESLKSSYSE